MKALQNVRDALREVAWTFAVVLVLVPVVIVVLFGMAVMLTWKPR